MDDASASQLEDLLVEILVAICRYLSDRELYSSFSRLNICLDSILKSRCPLFLVTIPHLDPLLSFFDSFHAVQIYFNDLCSSTLSQFNFSNFIGVRSFSIFRSTYSDRFIETIEQLEKFIYPDLCPYLQSLQLPIIHKHSLIGFLQGAFPHLRICHFYNSIYEKTVRLPTTTNTIPILRQLTIQEVTDKFDKIFLLCPNLVYFDFDRTRVFSSFIHLNSSYSSLKRLKIQRLKLHLTVDQCLLHDETLDFHKVAYYFRSSSSSNASTIQMFRQILQSSTCCFI